MENERWPFPLGTKGALDEGFRRAREVLDPQTYPDHWRKLKRVELLKSAGRELGAHVEEPPLFVNFRREGLNGSGVHQHPCLLCGNCNSGCNFGAKNTVLMNYLPRARRAGARIFREVSVNRLARHKSGWTVHYTCRGPDDDGWEGSITARRVILAAGALGSTEILLRSQDPELELSDTLGHGFSGNGDVLGFAFDGRANCNSVGRQRGGRRLHVRRRRGRRPVGPAISGILIPATSETRPRVRIEDNTWPGPIAILMPEFLSFAAAVDIVRTRRGVIRWLEQKLHQLQSLVLGPRYGAVAHSLALLGMTVDDAKGQMTLEDNPRRLVGGATRLGIAWRGAGSSPSVERVQDAMRNVARAIKADFVPNPIGTHTFNRSSITTHPLGGCAMGASAETGVVDHLGRVFKRDPKHGVHPGLYVLDGSIIPVSLGANPALTIAAIAERNVKALLEDKDELGKPDGPAPPPPFRPPFAHTVGLQFCEALSGWLSPVPPGADAPLHLSTFLAAVGDGRTGEGTIRYDLMVTSHNTKGTLSDPRHTFHLSGHVVAPSIAAGRLTVTHGTLELFVPDDAHTGTVDLTYRMVLRSTKGEGYLFEGFKVIQDGGPSNLWSQTNTLFITVSRGTNASRQVIARGIMYRGVPDFVRCLMTMRPLHARTRREGLAAILGFQSFFVKSLFKTYGGFLAPTTAYDPSAQAPLIGRVDARPPLSGASPSTRPRARGERHPFRARDGVELLLTRYRGGGDKGPVLLTHGMGASSLVFVPDSIQTNLVEFLLWKGYDVWLLDYRASIDLAASSNQFTADMVARHDYPAAVEFVLRTTKAARVKVVAHCFGATTFLMSVLGGYLNAELIGAAVCSQNGYHVIQPFLTWIKASAHLDIVFRLLRITLPTVRARKDDPRRTRLVDFLLRLYPMPAGESCHDEVCHRATFFFGLLYNHANLNRATHDGLGDLFGTANLRALTQLAAITRAGHLVDERGRDFYDHPERMRLRLSFIHGATNRSFLPESTQRTYDWLVARNGPGLYDRREFPGYGHIDCIFGRDAATDVYPYIEARLR